MNNKIIDNEIDLIKFLKNIWKKKNQIILILTSFVFFSFLFYLIINPPYIIKTEIQPMKISDEKNFQTYNSIINNNFLINFNFDETENINSNNLISENLDAINSNYLLSLFIEKFKQREILIKAIDKYELLNKSNYKDDATYFDAIKKKAYSVELIPPVNIDGKRKGTIRLNWQIKFVTKDKIKWLNILDFTNEEINKAIKIYLVENFYKSIQNIDLISKINIENLETQIQNLKMNYRVKSKNRIAFLEEQSSIAKAMNLENNILEKSNDSIDTFKYNSYTDGSDYYLRGYKVIDKELEIIKSRNLDEIEPFLENIDLIQNKILNLKQDKSLKYIETIFNGTPLIKSKKFKTAEISIFNSELKRSIEIKIFLIISFVIGLVFAITYSQISRK